VPLKESWPQDAAIRISKNFTQVGGLADFMPNILNALIVSPKVQQLIHRLEVPDVELLPVKVLDQQNAVLAPDFAFLNPLGGQDAIDMEKAKYRMGSLNKTQIARIKDFVLKPQGIAPTAKLFRCTNYLRLFLVRDDVREVFEAAGVTGLRYVTPDGWDGSEL
jgi:hypothetical protein